MDLSHDTLVAFAKSFGLFYMLGIFLAAVVYALWPANRQRFDRAARSILDSEDGPCR